MDAAIPSDKTLTNNGTIGAYGEISGSLSNNGTIIVGPKGSVPPSSGGSVIPFPHGETYLDANGTPQNIPTTGTKLLLPETTVLSGGWYVVRVNVTLREYLTVTGNVHLILMDGCKLDAQKGITVNENDSLTIYAQSNDEVQMGALTATGDYDQAGIGGGYYGAGGTITISGGSGSSVGIGAGTDSESSGNFSTGGGNAFIIANGGISDKTGQKNWSGVIFEWDEGQVYGTPTLETDATIPSGKCLEIPTVTTLTIDNNVTLTNNGVIGVYGTISGSLTNNGTIMVGPDGSIPETVPGTGSVVRYPSNRTYLDEDGTSKPIPTGTKFLLPGMTALSGWYVVFGNVILPECPTVTGDVHLILVDGCKLDAQKGIIVEGSNSLTIYAQSNGSNMGKLTATGYIDQAGIGGGWGGNGGTFITGTDGNAFITASSISDNDDTTGWSGELTGNGTIADGITVDLPTAPTITAQPQAKTVSVGETAEFTVAASGNPAPTYQWQVNKGNRWENIPNAKNSSYTTEAAAMSMNGWQYRCVAANDKGTATSDPATLTVQKGVPPAAASQHLNIANHLAKTYALWILLLMPRIVFPSMATTVLFSQ